VVAGQPVVMQCSANLPSTIEWNLGDGSPAATGNRVSHVYEQGQYVVTCTATAGAQTNSSELVLDVD
jgi:hypothetical protein